MNAEHPPPIPNKHPTMTRTRPGLKKMGLKLFLCLWAVGLLPVSTWLLFFNSTERQDARLGKVYQELLAEHRDLSNSSIGLKKELQATRAEQLRMSQLVNAYAEFHNMVSNLTPLVSGKDKDTLIADTRVKTALRSKKALFTHVALLHIATDTALLLGSNKPGGPTRQSLPELYKQQRSASKPPSSLSFSEWHWLPLGTSEYQLAVHMTEPEPAEPQQDNQISTPDPGRLEAIIHQLGDNRLALSPTTYAVLALLGLLLAVLAFLWIRTRLLLPIDRVTRNARRLLENPSDSDIGLYRPAGLLEDLSGSLTQLQTRTLRIEELDTQLDDIRNASTHICDVLDEASRGQLGVRAVVRPGGCEEIAAAINRLLDFVGEKLETFHRASQHLQSSANQLQEFSAQFSQTVLSSGTEQPHTDLGLAGEVLGTEVDHLCRQAQALIDDLGEHAQAQLAPSTQDTQISPLASATGGLRLLAQQIQEIKSSIDRISTLHQETEMLTTKLAIATEARSWGQLERLVEDTRALSNKMGHLFESLNRDLKELALMGRTLEEITKQAADLYNRRSEQLQAWEGFLETWQHRKEPLVHQIETVHPVANSLGEQLSRLSKDTMRYRASLLHGQKIVQQIGQSAAALATAADEIILNVKQMKLTRLAPATWTSGLVERQRSLERAIRELTELATQEGIEVLNTDTQTILGNIRSAAEQAQQRLLLQAEKEKPTGATRPEIGA